MVTVGPTTSMRMEKFEEAFIKETGVRLIIGKGGMGEGTMRGCRDNKALHCVFPAGCAVVAATCVEKILSANWKDLGMPETLWTCQVKEFGPLIVSIDTHGRNLFEENKVIFNERKDKVYEEIGELRAELEREDKEASLDELGDFLFSVVNAARLYHLNPDTALERTNHKFMQRFGYIEQKAKEMGKELKDMTLGEMDSLWEEAKRSGQAPQP